MKRYFIIIIIFMIFFSVYTKSYAQDDVSKNIVTPFLNALKSGNTAKLLQYIDGPLYKRNEVSLKKNNTYADLLKNKYGKVEFLINKISSIDHDKLVADILSVYPDGNTIRRILILYKKEGSNSWKIIKEQRIRM
ncbi:MAG: hypothetical protein KAR07_02805 [Spirochaetes bacterium]|nr:hypothetical protein [Spirochaetota bacterium]MCK5509782.1 hypothetical protein [Desulfobacterales bacterium]